jgi:prolipoprotein diacylglyceryl transferase
MPRGADIAAMGGILGMAVGRIGDVINGEHFASDTGLPWGVRYTHPESPSFIRLSGSDVVQHPAVAYEMIGDLVIFGFLLLIFLRVNRAGVTFFAYVFLYGLLRTLVSFLRLDDIVLVGLRTAQLIGIVAMVGGLGGIAYLLRTAPDEGGSRAAKRRLLREDVPQSAAEEVPRSAAEEEPATWSSPSTPSRVAPSARKRKTTCVPPGGRSSFSWKSYTSRKTLRYWTVWGIGCPSSTSTAGRWQRHR